MDIVFPANARIANTDYHHERFPATAVGEARASKRVVKLSRGKAKAALPIGRKNKFCTRRLKSFY